MAWHGCTYHRGDSWENRVTGDRRKTTLALMGYGGRYRCAECKRRVEMTVDDETYAMDLQMMPRVEPPYPDGWCGTAKVN